MSNGGDAGNQQQKPEDVGVLEEALLENQNILLDLHGMAADFIDQYLPLEWVGYAGNSLADHILHPRIRQTNWPDPPPLKINQICWPTGASRWMYGYLLCDAQTYIELFIKNASSHPARQAARLKLKFGGQKQIQVSTYILQPRRVTVRFGTGSISQLWILPIVDNRYHFQFSQKLAAPAQSSRPSWTELIEMADNALPNAKVLFDGIAFSGEYTHLVGAGSVGPGFQTINNDETQFAVHGTDSKGQDLSDKWGNTKQGDVIRIQEGTSGNFAEYEVQAKPTFLDDQYIFDVRRVGGDGNVEAGKTSQTGGVISPDFKEFYEPTSGFFRGYLNAAQVLDNAAWSLGMRVVPEIETGDLRLLRPADAKSRQMQNLETRPENQIAGGAVEESPMPGQLIFMYPLATGNTSDVTCIEYWPVVRDLDEDDCEYLAPDQTLQLQCTMFAVGTPTPRNQSLMDDLIDEWLPYWIGWNCGTHLDYVVQGILHEWKFTGFEDCVIWTLGTEFELTPEARPEQNNLRRQFEYRAHTTILAMPYNFSPLRQLSQNPESLDEEGDYTFRAGASSPDDGEWTIDTNSDPPQYVVNVKDKQGNDHSAFYDKLRPDDTIKITGPGGLVNTYKILSDPVVGGSLRLFDVERTDQNADIADGSDTTNEHSIDTTEFDVDVCKAGGSHTFIRFKLLEPMTTSDETANAEVTGVYRAAGGVLVGDQVTVHNMPTSEDQVFLFEGEEEARGLAERHIGEQEDEFHIFQLQCPPEGNEEGPEDPVTPTPENGNGGTGTATVVSVNEPPTVEV